MMDYPRQLIAQERLPLPQCSTAPPPVQIMELVCTLSSSFGMAPTLCPSTGRTTTLLYGGVAYLWQDIAQHVGAFLEAGEAYALRFFGTTRARQRVQLRFWQEAGGMIVSRESPSGKEFDYLQGLALQLDWESPQQAREMEGFMACLPSASPFCAVVSRSHREQLAQWGLLVEETGGLFSYLAWEETSKAQRLSRLNFSQKMMLWHAFLDTGRQWAELDWLWQDYYDGAVPCLLEWELALQQVLEQLHFRLEREAHLFRLLDGNGVPRRLDLIRGGSGEKLLLKLLFPLDSK